MVTDKGTFDAVGLSQDAAANRKFYITAVSLLLKPGGLLVITSCNTTREELTAEFCCRRGCTPRNVDAQNSGVASDHREGRSLNGVEGLSESGASAGGGRFEYVDHVRTYPVFRFGGIEGSRVCTVAFRRI